MIGDPVVWTTAGRVRGTREPDVAVFRGIPFADLPARFAAPEPVRSWAGIREATAFGPPPPQSGLFGREGSVKADTGWLTVNVWTSDLNGMRPVMVWVQGGGYQFGTSGLPEYDGSRLARDGVVVVTFNYRVGVEGFALIDGTPANRGLLDQVAALAWVRDNIDAFGGDPARVTLFGQSAGGGCVAALLAMPTATGLFHRAIVQSMPGVYLVPELASDITGALAAELGVAAIELATVAPWDLPEATDTLMTKLDAYTDRWGLVAHRKVPIAPVVDGVTLPHDPWHTLAAGRSRDIDLIVGHTRHEQRLFTLMDGLLGHISDDQAALALDLFAPTAEGPKEYRASGASPEELYDQVHSDWLFRMPSLHLAQAHTGRTHLYELAWNAPSMDGMLGACHGLDVPLVFGNLTSGQPAMLVSGDVHAAGIISTHLRRAWTKFAADGDPGWPTYDPEQQRTQVFDIDPTLAPYPEAISRRIWQDHVFSALPLLTPP